MNIYLHLFNIIIQCITYSNVISMHFRMSFSHKASNIPSALESVTSSDFLKVVHIFLFIFFLLFYAIMTLHTPVLKLTLIMYDKSLGTEDRG